MTPALNPSEPTTAAALGWPLSYRQLRRRHCIQALRHALRRWGTYLVIVAAVAGVGAPALAAAAVLPLMRSVSHPGWWILTVAAYVAALSLLPWSARHLLWPAHWSEVERQLPLARAQVVLSDLEVLAFAQVPAALVMVSGAAAVLAQAPPWLQGREASAVLSLAGALAGSIALGALGLQWLRKPVEVLGAWRRPRRMAAAVPARRSWAWSLVWAPLARGAAPRTAQLAAAGATLLLLTPLAAWFAPLPVTACLMVFSALALMITTRLNALARQELQPLHDACRMLPLGGAALARVRAALCLAPAAAGLLLWLPVLLASPVRPLVLIVFMAVSLGGWIVHVRAPSADAAAGGAGWLLTLALGLALASEVIR